MALTTIQAVRCVFTGFTMFGVTPGGGGIAPTKGGVAGGVDMTVVAPTRLGQLEMKGKSLATDGTT